MSENFDAIALATPTNTPISTYTPTPWPTHTPTATPIPSTLDGTGQVTEIGETGLTPTVLPDLPSRPRIPIIGDATERIRSTLPEITNIPRQRMTLIIILILTGLIVAGVFLYLVLRRR